MTSAPSPNPESDRPSEGGFDAEATFASFRRAEAAFTRVLEIDPADHYARFALGKALQRQGRFTESLAQLRMASAMDPRPEYQDAIGEVSARIAISERD